MVPPNKGISNGKRPPSRRPVSTFPFLIVMENLNILMEEAIGKNLYEGLLIGHNMVSVSHLQYADDAIFFGKWSKGNLKNLLKILECFRLVSGLKINLRKSKLFGVGIVESEVRSWANEIGCEGGSLPFTYLGLPVGASMRKINDWRGVVDKVTSKLGSWKAKSISFGGRLTLVKSWDKVVAPFSKWGLNVGDLFSMNSALLAKWWWHFLSGEDSFWVKIIKSIYGVHGGLWGRERSDRESSGRCSVWNNIVKVGECLCGEGQLFSNGFLKVVGDGESTSFWRDKWVSEVSLAETFPRLLRLEVESNVTVFNRGKWVDNRWVWEWSWRREPRGREVGELRGLEVLLRGKDPVKDKKDWWEWSLEVGKGFSVKRYREAFIESRGTVDVGSVETLWCKLVPKKVNIFMWRARIGRLPTRESLNGKGIDLHSTLCPRCGAEVESLDHALLNCTAVKEIWRYVGRWWNKNVVGMGSIQQFLQEDSMELSSSKGKSKWIAVKWSMLYLLWQNRNEVVFKNLNSDLGNCFFVWQRCIFEWIGSNTRSPCDWFEWISPHIAAGIA
ncbi:hypothetical protein OSB04_000238 [Centaurea solstitialis]|uniref:Reverse transcriptase domain-containing protein n=1 Tax=Centaurea solstitialis TaxID=347529 RepID=A0AA38WKC4_9ASTR|nr:hypothetical protein OSB04_000238 [Centaurea solstitialis]